MVDLNNYIAFYNGLHYYSDDEEEANVERFDFATVAGQSYNDIYGNSRRSRAINMRNGILPASAAANLPNNNEWNFYVHRQDIQAAIANRQGIVRVRTQKFNVPNRQDANELFQGWQTEEPIANVPPGIQNYYVRVENERVVNCTCPDKKLRELGGPGCKHQRLVRMLLGPRRRRTTQQRLQRRLAIEGRGSYWGAARRNRRRRR